MIEFLGHVPLSDEGGGLGVRIVQLRRVLGIRQKDPARELGVDPSTLAQWGQGQPSDRHREKAHGVLRHEVGRNVSSVYSFVIFT